VEGGRAGPTAILINQRERVALARHGEVRGRMNAGTRAKTLDREVQKGRERDGRDGGRERKRDHVVQGKRDAAAEEDEGGEGEDRE